MKEKKKVQTENQERIKTPFSEMVRKFKKQKTAVVAKLDENKTKEMMSYAERGYRALRIECYARLDFLMNDEGKLFCLEANTLPGMTPTSLVPQEAAAMGINFNDLVEKMLRSALDK